jgi:lycopene cyclase domain-containing protein
MFTYAVMGLPFILAVLIVDWFVLKTRVIKKRDTWIIMAIMMGFTAVFDQFLTGLPIVLYDTNKTLGVQLGYAPIEDFFYAFVAVVAIGSLLTYTSHEKVSKQAVNQSKGSSANK